MKKTFDKWDLLYAALIALALFSLFASPRIVAGVMSANKGNIVTVSGGEE